MDALEVQLISLRARFETAKTLSNMLAGPTKAHWMEECSVVGAQIVALEQAQESPVEQAEKLSEILLKTLSTKELADLYKRNKEAYYTPIEQELHRRHIDTEHFPIVFG